MAAAVAVAIAALSGGSGSDPRTPRGLPGIPAPLFGTAVIGSGGVTGAVDSYGNVVDLRRPGPAGPALLAIKPQAQEAGTADQSEARLARVAVEGGATPLWEADAVTQSYLPGTNALRTTARFGPDRFTVVRSIGGMAAARADRRWVGRAKPPGVGAPAWARRMHERSLLVLRALTDRRTGAVSAGAREGWAYVWPRDAAAVALALAEAGYRVEARRIAHFLLVLDLAAAARFDGRGEPVPGRAAQGDAAGWVAAAARAAAIPASQLSAQIATFSWQDRADYQEKSPGEYLANAISTADGTQSEVLDRFESRRRVVVRVADDFGSGLDSAAAWAVRPFPRPALFPAVRRTLLELAAEAGRFGIVPSQDWPEEDPWTAPTAWTAWSLAALGERRAALRLMRALRRAATPLGLLPERVDARTGVPRSTTPLAWSHAFAILAIHELWPVR